MAEQVQEILDRMVPALRDLMDREIFSESEVKAIVTRRREYEYLLRRRMPRKSDYARYIQDEKNLEKLRQLRTKKVMARLAAKEREERKSDPDKKPTKRSNNGIGTASIVQHIHLLYVRVKRKWKDDIAWHLQHAEFAKESKSFSMLGKIYAEALQVHPRNIALWIEAASHEYFGHVVDEFSGGMSGGGSIKSARVLLQRGLRVNPDAQDLWIQSFCLELHYIQKLRGRRELLHFGLQNVQSTSDNDSADECHSLGSTFYKDAKLPRIIFHNAIKAIPNSVEFRLKFVDQCLLFPETDAIVTDITESIESDFPNVEEAWIARARFAAEKENDTSIQSGFVKQYREDISRKRKHEPTDTVNGLQDSVSRILDEATDSIRTAKMYSASIAFVKSYIQTFTSYEMNDLRKLKVISLGAFLKFLVEKSLKDGVFSPQLAVESASILADIDDPSNALDYITRVTTDGPFRQSAVCLMKRAELKARLENSSSACQVLRSAVNSVPIHDSGHWIVLSNLFLTLLVQPCSKDKEIATTFEKLVLLGHHRKSECEDIIPLPTLAVAYLRYLSFKGNPSAIESIRKIYRQFLFNSTYIQMKGKSDSEIFAAKTFIDECILSEKMSSGTDKANLLHLYDCAIKLFQDHGHSELASIFSRRKEKEM